MVYVIHYLLCILNLQRDKTKSSDAYIVILRSNFVAEMDATSITWENLPGLPVARMPFWLPAPEEGDLSIYCGKGLLYFTSFEHKLADWFYIKTPSHQYKDSHYKNETAKRPSYLTISYLILLRDNT